MSRSRKSSVSREEFELESEPELEVCAQLVADIQDLLQDLLREARGKQFWMVQAVWLDEAAKLISRAGEDGYKSCDETVREQIRTGVELLQLLQARINDMYNGPRYETSVTSEGLDTSPIFTRPLLSNVQNYLGQSQTNQQRYG